jgi:FkbM family methyltransferase
MNPLLRYHARKWLRRLAPPSQRHHRDMESVARHLRKLGFIPGTIIDVGVANGTYDLYRVWPEARLLLVEPIPEFEAACRYISTKHGNGSTYVMAAAGASNGTIDLHYSTNLQGASLVSAQTHCRRTTLVTVDSLAAELPEPFLLKIDVQGAECMVLDGATEALKRSEVVMLETQLYDFVGTGATIVEIVSRMRDAGFAPFDIYDGLLRPYDKSLGQIDVAFVEIDGQFRQSNQWGSAEQNRHDEVIQTIRRLIGIR